MYMPEAPKLKLNLPTSLERDFAKGALGDERETQVYNFDILDQAAKAGYLKDTRTEADLFRTGFFGLEDTPKYAFTEKADDRVKYDLFNLLDYKTPQSRIDAFKEIEERNKFRDAREAYSKLHNDTLPGMEETTQQGFIKPAGELRNERIVDKFKQKMITEKLSKQHNYTGLKNNIADKQKYLAKPGMVNSQYKTADDVISDIHTGTKTMENIMGVAKETISDISNLDIPESLSSVASTGKAIAKKLGVLDLVTTAGEYGLSVYQDIENGQSIERAVFGNLVNKLASTGYSAFCAIGGAAAGAVCGSHIPILGTTAYGLAGGIAASVFSQDAAADFGDKVEKAIFDPPPEAFLILK